MKRRLKVGREQWVHGQRGRKSIHCKRCRTTRFAKPVGTAHHHEDCPPRRSISWSRHAAGKSVIRSRIPTATTITTPLPQPSHNGPEFRFGKRRGSTVLQFGDGHPDKLLPSTALNWGMSKSARYDGKTTAHGEGVKKIERSSQCRVPTQKRRTGIAQADEYGDGSIPKSSEKRAIQNKSQLGCGCHDDADRAASLPLYCGRNESTIASVKSARICGNMWIKPVSSLRHT